MPPWPRGLPSSGYVIPDTGSYVPPTAESRAACAKSLCEGAVEGSAGFVQSPLKSFGLYGDVSVHDGLFAPAKRSSKVAAGEVRSVVNLVYGIGSFFVAGSNGSTGGTVPGCTAVTVGVISGSKRSAFGRNSAPGGANSGYPPGVGFGFKSDGSSWPAAVQSPPVNWEGSIGWLPGIWMFATFGSDAACGVLSGDGNCIPYGASSLEAVILLYRSMPELLPAGPNAFWVPASPSPTVSPDCP